MSFCYSMFQLLSFFLFFLYFPNAEVPADDEGKTVLDAENYRDRTGGAQNKKILRCGVRFKNGDTLLDVVHRDRNDLPMFICILFYFCAVMFRFVICVCVFLILRTSAYFRGVPRQPRVCTPTPLHARCVASAHNSSPPPCPADPLPFLAQSNRPLTRRRLRTCQLSRNLHFGAFRNLILTDAQGLSR